ncbi:uncharacterized protein LOC111045288 isoform X2 [Nilaparvata lugens]|uniref:uncharacterized protein LOC111045288 isoform X2 n=1 Tax=Nilaparvata lugens TaxID=108931 RepID=UPI000B99C987|nr:uncharacterized protein LOC111045288 isoform X2 [Nilaparvata lugens]
MRLTKASMKKIAHSAVDPFIKAEVDSLSLKDVDPLSLEVTNPSITNEPDTIPLCVRNRPIFCTSNRGKLKLMFNGFGYTFHRARGKVSVWIFHLRLGQ